VPRAIGIDLGQTNSRIAWLSGAEGPQILPNSDNERFMPTLLAQHPSGQFLSGRGAAGVLAASPERVVWDLVARLATGQLATLEGQSYRPESLMAFFLRKLKADAEARLNDTVTQAYVTVPPTWNAAARKRLCDAGSEAGLSVTPVESSVAAALAAGFRAPSDRLRYILVYDLGGTNFSVTLLALGGPSLVVRKTATLAGVGGAAFDQLIVDYVTVLVEQQHQVDPRVYGRFMAELRKQAEQAKILLGAHRATDVRIAGMLRTPAGSPLDVDVEIEREEFERMLEDPVRSTLLATLSVVGEAGVALEQIDSVILVGGSTSIPAVRSAVESFVGVKKVVENVNPLEAPALGAAWMTGALEVNVQPADPAAIVVVAGAAAPPPVAEVRPEPTPMPQPAPQPAPAPAPEPQPPPAPQPPPQERTVPPPPPPPPPPPSPPPAAQAEAEPDATVREARREAPAPPAPAVQPAPQPTPPPAPAAPAPAGPPAHLLIGRWLIGAAATVAVLYVAYFIWQLRPPEYVHVRLHPSETILQRELRTFQQELPDRICEAVREASQDGSFSVADRLGVLNYTLAEQDALNALFRRSNTRAPGALWRRDRVMTVIERCSAAAQ